MRKLVDNVKGWFSVIVFVWVVLCDDDNLEENYWEQIYEQELNDKININEEK